MSKQSDRNRVAKDERDAEKAYQANENAEKAETKRVAAAETEATLRKVEELGKAKPAAVKRKSFWDWLTRRSS